MTVPVHRIRHIGFWLLLVIWVREGDRIERALGGDAYVSDVWLRRAWKR